MVCHVVDSPWKVLPSLRNGWRCNGLMVGGAGGREVVGTGIAMQMRKDYFKRN